MSRVGWLDCGSGVSGDMLLGALTALGALDDLPAVVETLGVGARVSVGAVRRGGLAATRVEVAAPGGQPHRTPDDLVRLVDRAPVPQPVRERAAGVLRRLAEVEARVHGVSPDEVHLHEVGAVDTVVDVVGACLGLHALGLDRLVVSPVALGGGTARTLHGDLPVPVPAVLELLAGCGLAAYGGPGDAELATPTGVAVVAAWADASGPMPAMTVTRVGLGAGGRDPAGLPNVLRLVVGEAVAGEPAGGEPAAEDALALEDALVLEANVDDLDPRLWPGALAALLDAGASDAWLTPILMKKGRPAHTLHVLAPRSRADAVRRLVFTETSTIGLREWTVAKRALERSVVSVSVDGQPVRVKVARLRGAAVNAVPEFDDVAAAAAALGRPAKAVLAAATSAATAVDLAAEPASEPAPDPAPDPAPAGGPAPDPAPDPAPAGDPASGAR